MTVTSSSIHDEYYLEEVGTRVLLVKSLDLSIGLLLSQIPTYPFFAMTDTMNTNEKSEEQNALIADDAVENEKSESEGTIRLDEFLGEYLDERGDELEQIAVLNSEGMISVKCVSRNPELPPSLRGEDCVRVHEKKYPLQLAVDPYGPVPPDSMGWQIVYERGGVELHDGIEAL